MSDLGTVGTDPCSRESSINSKGQIVGGSSNCSYFLHAYLWEKGGPMIDLNTLVPAGSDLQLTVAVNINDRGEIIGLGVPPGCPAEKVATCGHAFLLIPCGEGQGCGNGTEGMSAATQNSLVPVIQRNTTAAPASPALSHGPTEMLDRLRARRFPSLRTLGSDTGPVN